MAKTKKMAFGGMGNMPQRDIGFGGGPRNTGPMMPPRDIGFGGGPRRGGIPPGLPPRDIGVGGNPRRGGMPFGSPPRDIGFGGGPRRGEMPMTNVYPGRPDMGGEPQGGMEQDLGGMGGTMMKKGGAVKAKAFANGGSVSKVSSASSRADGCATKGKTKGRMV